MHVLCITETGPQRPNSALNRLKAKIVRLHSRRLQKILDYNNYTYRPGDDIPHLSDETAVCRADHIFLERWNRAEVYDTERNNTEPYNFSTEHVRHNRGEQCQRRKIDGGSPLRAAYFV